MDPLSRTQPHYFGAGPALMPTEVLRQAALDLINYEGLGIGVGEMSHRSGSATQLINSTKAKISQLLDIPDTHEVFFAQGGGWGGFASVPCNLLASFAAKTGKKGKVDYFVTGSWSASAVKEAKRLGIDVNIVADGRDVSSTAAFGAIPPKSSWKFSDPSETAYVYYCDNETVNGVEFPSIPEVPEGVELVADMSSNFLSRPVDVSKFGLIFGGAQKNIGLAGVALYIIKKSLLTTAPVEELRKLDIPVIPTFLEFSTIVKNNSAFNTLSLFALDVVKLNMDYLLNKGGLEAQLDESQRKSGKLYALLDKYPKVFKLVVSKDVRSRMNIVFTIPGDGLEERFIKEAGDEGLTGLKGHRSVGGIRISSYNAVSETSTDALHAFLTKFASSVSSN